MTTPTTDRKPVFKSEVTRRAQLRTIEVCAKQARMGADYWGLMEQGRFIPNADQIKRIAAVLGMDPDDVLREVDLTAK